MKVLYLINYAGKAGSEKYVRDLIEFFHGEKAECFFVYNIEGLLSQQIKAKNIKTSKLEMKHPFDIKAAYKLAQICKKNKIDVIHAQYPMENYIAILSKIFYNNVKVIYTSHLTLPKKNIWRFPNRFITRFNHKIISVCNESKEFMIKNGVKKDKIVVIYNGVLYPNDPIKNDEIRKEFLLDNEFVLVILARYMPEKGLDFLINSLEHLKSISKKSFKCLIVGDGMLYDEIGKLINEKNLSDNIIQTGFRHDVDNILLSADIYLNSSKCLEALSFAILEGMSKGLPVVATDVGGNRDIVEKDIRCGFIVNYGDFKAYAQGIYEIMNDENLYEEFSKNSIKKVREIFNLQKSLEDLYDIYLEDF